jgi:predicted kinase
MRRAPPPRAALLPLSLLFIHCVSSALVTHRERPSTRATHAALERATPRAARCLRAGDRVTVEGFFDGPTGRFRVERTGASDPATPDAVRQCVALQIEAARVGPFSAPRHAARWTVADAISPAVRAMLAADASVGDAPALEGDIDLPAVVRAMRAQVGEVRRCYEDALAGDPTLRGVVELRFTITVDGRLVDATARPSTPGLQPVAHCALGHLRGLSWPPARGAAVDFSFPFTFAPEDASTRGSPGSR